MVLHPLGVRCLRAAKGCSDAGARPLSRLMCGRDRVSLCVRGRSAVVGQEKDRGRGCDIDRRLIEPPGRQSPGQFFPTAFQSAV
jgi:hypothetical protein